MCQKLLLSVIEDISRLAKCFFFAFCKRMLLKIHCFLYSFCEVSVLLHKKFIAKSRAVFIRYSKMFSSKEHVWLKLLWIDLENTGSPYYLNDILRSRCQVIDLEVLIVPINYHLGKTSRANWENQICTWRIFRTSKTGFMF